MISYMDYVEQQFLESCGWGRHESYANVNLSSQNILDFKVPFGAWLQLNSQPSKVTLNNCTFSGLGSIQGSISYLYTPIPIDIIPSVKAPLDLLSEHFFKVESPPLPTTLKEKQNLLYGRMFMPAQAVEAMAIHRLGPSTQLVSKWVCDPRLPKPFVLTSTWQRRSPNHTTELIWSSHENLLGVQALYNVASWTDITASFQSKLAMGFELFYAASKKAPGLSLASRYSTYSKYTATPLTLTTVLNPLMGNISVAYALKPTQHSALSSRFDFNLYSYVSDLTVGGELWRTEPISAAADQPKLKNKVMSVFKASTSLATQTLKVLFETSYKDFMISLGAIACYSDRSTPIHYGIELIYCTDKTV